VVVAVISDMTETGSVARVHILKAPLLSYKIPIKVEDGSNQARAHVAYSYNRSSLCMWVLIDPSNIPELARERILEDVLGL